MAWRYIYGDLPAIDWAAPCSLRYWREAGGCAVTTFADIRVYTFLMPKDGGWPHLGRA
jgi:hypothetical protein